MNIVTVLLIIAVGAIVVLGALLEDSRNALARERIRREEADAWAEQFEGSADALRTENARLREQLATVQALYAERTRDLLAQNYWIIGANMKWKRRKQQ